MKHPEALTPGRFSCVTCFREGSWPPHRVQQATCPDANTTRTNTCEPAPVFLPQLTADTEFYTRP